MRKKLLCLCLSVVMAFGACACTSTNDGKGENGQTTAFSTTAATTADATTAGDATAAATSGDATAAMQEILNGLVEENLNCMRNIFDLGMLPTQGEPVDGEWIYQVSEEYFKDFAEFETYVRSVFCKETADMYLYSYPYEDGTKYLNIDGKLYENKMYDGGKGYYVDWTNYSISIDSLSDTECNFTVNCTVEWPADKPVVEPYPVKGTALYEDGRWVLESMLY